MIPIPVCETPEDRLSVGEASGKLRNETSVTSASLSSRIQEVLEYYALNHQFMGSVLVACGDSILFCEGVGWANWEWKIPNISSSKYRIACLSMQLTAACILLLEEQGRIELNAPVGRYIEDAPSQWEKITVFHLLTHTSGLACYTKLSSYPAVKTRPASPRQLIDLFRDEELVFLPGAAKSESISNYVLLGHILEILTGKHYADWVRRNIFTPLGMNDSDYDSNSAIIPNRSSGYVMGAKRPVNASYIHMSVPFAAGGFISTAPDLFLWLRGLFGGRILRPESLRKMLTPYLNDFAFGWAVKNTENLISVEHGGNIDGFSTFLTYLPDREISVIVLSNFKGAPVGDIALKLKELALGRAVTLPSERRTIEAPPELLGIYAGSYETGGESPQILEITLKGNRLLLQTNVGAKYPMLMESKDKFFLANPEMQCEFVRNEDGSITQLLLWRHGTCTSAQRLK